MRYPPTRTVREVEFLHGIAVANPYQWLEHQSGPEIERWVDEQDGYARDWIGRGNATQWFVERLARRLRSEWRGAPRCRRGRQFQLRRDAGDDQSSLWVRDSAGERCLIGAADLAEVAAVAIAGFVPSPDGSGVAWLAMATGSDWKTLRVRDVRTGTDTADTLDWLKSSAVSWRPDSAALFYLRFPTPGSGAELTARSDQTDVAMHVLGTDQASDASVFHHRDSPWLTPYVDCDGQWLLVQQHTGTAPTGVFAHRLVTNGLDPDDQWRRIASDSSVNQVLGAQAGTAYLLTFRDAPNGRIVAVSLPDGSLSDSRQVLAESDTAFDATRGALDECYLLRDHLVAVTTDAVRSRVRIVSLDGAASRELELPGLAAVQHLQAVPGECEIFLEVSTVAGPMKLLRHEVHKATTTVVFSDGPDSAGDSAMVEEHRVRAHDGALVPVVLVHPAHAARDGTCPVLLSGYGGFGISYLPKAYKPWHDAWLTAGGMLAFAALRGGGELGQDWHEQGRREHKQNTFDDLFSCASWLVSEGWTQPSRLALHGSSNGGLLVAVAITQQPNMFAAAVCEAPLIDILRFQRYTVGGPWITEYGDPDDPGDFQTVLRYAPLERVRNGTRYPAVLVVTGDHDDRVPPGAHAYKFAASLQAAQAGDAPILLRVERSGGHGAGIGTAAQIAERADILSFLTTSLQVDVSSH